MIIRWSLTKSQTANLGMLGIPILQYGPWNLKDGWLSKLEVFTEETLIFAARVVHVWHFYLICGPIYDF